VASFDIWEKAMQFEKKRHKEKMRSSDRWEYKIERE